MIDERTEELAALYVLDVLNEQERRDFEMLLATSPDLKERVRELSLALHEPFKEAAGPVRMDLLPAIHTALGMDSRSTGKVPALKASIAPMRIPWSFVWAAAASLLLVLNLFLLLLVRGQGWSFSSSSAGHSGAAGLTGEASGGPVRFSSEEAREILEARIKRLESDLMERNTAIGQVLDSNEALKEENQEVKTYNAGWQREYMRLAGRILPFFQDNDRMSRFTVIEMVDAQSFEIPGKSRGFAELAGRFLTGEGNIAGAGGLEFVGPVMDAATASNTASNPSLTPASRGSTPPTPSLTADVPAPLPTEMAPAEDEPMGFTVWRDDEQKGFLDLYNLPQPESGEAFLWVRASDSEPYVPVGYLPSFENGTGSLFYSVEEPNFTPAEILITAEDPSQPGSQPSAAVLLRGP